MSNPVLPRQRAVPDLSLRRLMADDPVMTTAGLMILALLLPFAVAASLDPRLLDGEGVWTKPMQFAVSISIFLLTLAAFSRHIPEHWRRSWQFRGFGIAVALAALLEMLWIGGAAALGIRSHFNDSSNLAMVLYPIMGGVAALLTGGSLVYGLAIWRTAETGLRPAMQLAIVLGLVLTFPMTLFTAGTIAGQGALIGMPQADAVLPVLGWSLEVGDLRVAHFLSTHLLQILPVIVWLTAFEGRSAVVTTATILAALVLVTYAQALAGRPVLPFG